MALKAVICSKCGSKGLVPQNSSCDCFCGGKEVSFNVTEDQYIKMSEYEIQQMIEQMGINPLINEDDALTIYNATKSTEIIDAMIELKQRDIIEYGLKLGQFKTQVAQQKSSNTQNNNKPKCPTCNSTNLKRVSTTSKVVSVAMWGLLSQKAKKTWHCNSCGYEW